MCYTGHMNNDFLQFYTDTPKFTHAPTLDVMRALMARLGDPQRSLRCVHIAGTNGKGSCAAMVSAMLRAAGYRTGLYTSPDLTGPWERIQVDGVTINQADFAAATIRVKAACAGLPEPSYFEKLTAAAFLYFARRRCDYVVLEAGLGGWLDATNIIEKPAASVIMPIGLDHTAVLGGTLGVIAGEKAGILKSGCPAVCAPQQPEAEAVIRARCQTLGVPLHLVDITKMHPLSHDLTGQRLSYGEMEDVALPLLGHHQVENACTAMEAGRVLGLTDTVIRQGLAAAQWPCRFEYIPGTPPFILDGAHNGHGAAALVEGLRDYFPGARFTVLMGVMADKSWEEMLTLLTPLAERFVCIAPEGPQALPAEALAAAVAARGVPAQATGSLAEALTLCQAHAEPVCACGSLYYIGYLRAMLRGEPASWT